MGLSRVSLVQLTMPIACDRTTEAQQRHGYRPDLENRNKTPIPGSSRATHTHPEKWVQLDLPRPPVPQAFLTVSLQ
jgi:hypothetical protein